MAYQTGRMIEVAYKLEASYGELPDASGGKVLRVNSSPGLNLGIEAIQSNENRRDGQRTRGRHGTRTLSGQYGGDLSVGTYDDWIEAVFRGAFEVALEIDETDMASATLSVATGAINASGGSFITAGVRVGDVIRLGTGFAAGNQNRNIRVTGVSATSVTVAETLVVEAGPISDYAITRPKKLIQPSSGIVHRSWAIEEREIDIDGSEVSTGVRIGGMQLQLQPNGMAIITFPLAGRNTEVMTGGDSPYFTSPTETSSIGLTAVEAKIRLGSVDVADITALDINLNLNAAGQPVVGSNLTPEIFTNLAAIEGSVTMLKADASRVTQYLNETELSLHLVFEEKDSGLADFCSFYLGNFTLASGTKSDLGNDGARTQTFQLLIGKDLRGGAYDPTMIKFQTSAA